MKIFLSGANGFIGKKLLCKIAKMHDVTCLLRTRENIPDVKIIVGDATVLGKWIEELKNSDIVINLCGNDISRKWTTHIKQEIKTTRIQTTHNIASSMLPHQTLINASAIGYYGYSKLKTFDENAPCGRDFLAQVSQKWEEETTNAKECRVVIGRFGIVLGNGGALKKMLGNFQKYLGGNIGTGKQFFSWIHIDDVVSFITKAIENKNYKGVYNVCSPNPVCQRDFNEALSCFLPRMGGVKIPNFILKATIGEFANTLLEGQRVIPQRLQQENHAFLYPELNKALENIFHEN